MVTVHRTYEYTDYLAHFGIKGQKWGVRRYQNADGTYTDEGQAHYGFGDGNKSGMGLTLNPKEAHGYQSRQRTKALVQDGAKFAIAALGAYMLGKSTVKYIGGKPQVQKAISKMQDISSSTISAVKNKIDPNGVKATMKRAGLSLNDVKFNSQGRANSKFAKAVSDVSLDMDNLPTIRRLQQAGEKTGGNLRDTMTMRQTSAITNRMKQKITDNATRFKNKFTSPLKIKDASEIGLEQVAKKAPKVKADPKTISKGKEALDKIDTSSVDLHALVGKNTRASKPMTEGWSSLISDAKPATGKAYTNDDITSEIRKQFEAPKEMFGPSKKDWKASLKKKRTLSSVPSSLNKRLKKNSDSFSKFAQARSLSAKKAPDVAAETRRLIEEIDEI